MRCTVSIIYIYIYYIVYTVHCTVYTVHCTVTSVQCTLHSMQYKIRCIIYMWSLAISTIICLVAGYVDDMTSFGYYDTRGKVCFWVRVVYTINPIYLLVLVYSILYCYLLYKYSL